MQDRHFCRKQHEVTCKRYVLSGALLAHGARLMRLRPPPRCCVHALVNLLLLHHFFLLLRGICVVLLVEHLHNLVLCSSLPQVPPILFGVSPTVLPRPGYWPAKVGDHGTYGR